MRGRFGRANAFSLVADALADRLNGLAPSDAVAAAHASPATCWETVIAEADSQSVLPAFGAAVHDLGLERHLAAELAAFLKSVHAANKRRNASLADQLAEAVAVLNRRGIVPVALKGAVTFYEPIYPDQGWRLMRDLDLLVREDELSASIAALHDLGYSRGRGELRPVPLHHHYPPIRHPKRPAPLEIHTALFAARLRKILPAAEVFDRSRRLEIEGLAIRVPSIEHRMAHLIAHCQIGHNGYLLGRIKLRDRLDAVALARFSGAPVDWQWVTARFAATGQRRPLMVFIRSLSDAGFGDLGAGTRADFFVRMQSRRVALQVRSRPLMTLGVRGGWLAALCRDMLIQRETRSRLRVSSRKRIMRRIRRGPSG